MTQGQNPNNRPKVSIKLDLSEVDEAVAKIKLLEDMLKEANSLLNELASRDVAIKVDTVRT